MVAYRLVDGLKSPAGCTPGSDPRLTLSNEYERPLPLLIYKRRSSSRAGKRTLRIKLADRGSREKNEH